MSTVARDTEWKQFGLCHEQNDLFYPPDLLTTRSKQFNAAPAKAICADCPVRMDCLWSAIANNEQGIWGGTTEEERRDIRESWSHMGAEKPTATNATNATASTD